MNFTEIKDVISAACQKHGVAEYEIFYTEFCLLKFLFALIYTKGY